jgi:hypothetical protein
MGKIYHKEIPKHKRRQSLPPPRPTIEYIEDNPVPSLDNELINEIIKALKVSTYNGRSKLINILENGRETDNGQPKCTVCGTPTHRTQQNTNILVCIDCSH